MKKSKYNHVEAFCLMNYKCKACGEREQLWNSRDGVTPYIVSCLRCGGEMAHISQKLDYCCPDLQPTPKMRIFVDMTDEKRKEIAEKRIEIRKGTNFEISAERYEEFHKAISEEMPPGWPMIITAEEFAERNIVNTELKKNKFEEQTNLYYKISEKAELFFDDQGNPEPLYVNVIIPVGMTLAQKTQAEEDVLYDFLTRMVVDPSIMKPINEEEFKQSTDFVLADEIDTAAKENSNGNR